jgi:predicted phage terminase large subunit-like protein
MSEVGFDIPRTRSAYNRLLRDHFPFFLQATYDTLGNADPLAWNWHLDAMCHALDQVYRTDGRRLVITIPPRHLKTVTVSIAFVAWALGRDPTQRFLCVSYGADLSLKISRQFRQVVESSWYRSAFPDFQIDRATDGEISTTAGGYRNSGSINGAITGTGATYIVIDDANKTGDVSSPTALETAREFYRNTLVSRFNNPLRGKVVVVGQRIHEDDLPGWCIESGRFEHLNLPGIAQRDDRIPIGPGRFHERKVGDPLFPAFYPLWKLDELKGDMGPRVFSAQILQDPTPVDSDFITWSRIPRYIGEIDRDECLKVVQSWDTAEVDTARSDYSACTTWGWLRGKWLLLDVERFKSEPRGLLGRVRAYREKWRPDLILVEEAGSGRSLIAELTHERRTAPEKDLWGWKVQPCRPAASKVERWAAQAGKLESAFALLPETADWLEDLRFEITGFPQRRHDDQVDSISQFLQYTTWGRTAVALEREKNRGPDWRQRRSMRPELIAELSDDDLFWKDRIRWPAGSL